MKKILLADDHQIFNDGLKLILTPHFYVVSQVFHGRNVIHELQKHQPEIAVLDINLPGISGLEVGKEIKKNYSYFKLVYLSMYSEYNFIKAAKELNADGYLLKDTSSEKIIHSLIRISEGEKVFDEVLLSQNPNLHHDDYFVKQYALSKRELEVISLIRLGFSTEEISMKLFVSTETIKSHRKNIFLKLGISKVTELINFANKYNL